MKLSLQSWGGFAGPAGAVTRTVDLDALPADRASRGRALLEAARVFEQPAKLVLAKPKPWDFNYVLEVEDGTRSKKLQLQLDAVDQPLRTLVAWIEEVGSGAAHKVNEQ